MKLLVKESPLQVLPTLAMEVGLNEAILLQQLHFRSLLSRNERDGHKWIYRTYEEWKDKEFPFWSITTIKRIIRGLESNGYIVSTSSYNRMKIDKTKWYRIDYSKMQFTTDQNDLPDCPDWIHAEDRCGPSHEATMTLPITKELKNIIKEPVGKHPDVVSVINYLNEKAGKRFKPSSKATERLVKGRLREGYVLDDFKNVIDIQVEKWLNDRHWNQYLRPSTLFNATNFENYLENYRKSRENVSPQPFVLDFSKGEE